MNNPPARKSWAEMTGLEKLSAICARPEMYVATRNFNTVAVFINGCSLRCGGIVDPPYQINTAGFRLWLAAKLYASHKLPRNYGWDWYIQQLYPDNEEALSHLLVLYAEFIDPAQGEEF